MRRAMQPDLPPSVLDSPRFFDDETLSAWKRAVSDDDQERKVAASTTDMEKLDVRPLSWNKNIAFDNGEPLSIEIVRGLFGPADEEWRLVVDGVLQADGIHFFEDEEGRFVCTLPPPITSFQKESMVRPVVISVRLENEAMPPMTSTGQAYQRLETDEHMGQRKPKWVECGSQFPVHYYRTSADASEATSVPYPVWVPPYPSMGIVNFTREEFENRKENWNTRIGLVKDLLTGKQQATALGESIATTSFNNTIMATEAIKDAARVTTDVYNTFAAKSNKVKMTLGGGKQSVLRPRRTSNYASYVNVLDDASALEDGSTSYVIGGTTSSAILQLRDMVIDLIDVCTFVETELDNSASQTSGEGMNFLYIMRFVISEIMNNKRLLAFFDALLTAKVYPEQRLLMTAFTAWRGNRNVSLRWTYEMSKDGKSMNNARPIPRWTPDSDEMNAEQEDDNQGKTNEEQEYDTFIEKYKESAEKELEKFQIPESGNVGESDNSPFAFILDRIALQSRMHTLLETFLEVTLTEFDESNTTKFVFQVDKRDGLQAHAMYTNLVNDCNEFNDACDYFLDCIMNKFSGEPPEGTKGRRPGRLFNILASKIGKGNRLPSNPVKGLASIIGNLLKDDTQTNVQVPSVGNVDVSAFKPTNYEFQPWYLQERLGMLKSAVYSAVPDLDDSYNPQQQAEDALKQAREKIQNNESVDAGPSAQAKNEVKQTSEAVVEEDTSNFLVVRELPQVVLDSNQVYYEYKTYSYTTPLYKPFDPNESSNPIKTGLFTGLAAALFTGVTIFSKNEAQSRSVATMMYSLATSILPGMDALQSAASLAAPFILTYATTLKDLAFGQTAAMYGALRVSVSVGSSVVKLITSRQRLHESRRKAFHDHGRKVLGEPIKSCVASARDCMFDCRRQIEETQLKLFGVSNSVIVMHNQFNGERFVFRQWYMGFKREAYDGSIGKFSTIHGNDDWANVPNSSALSLLPPDSVAYKLYESETLRDIHMEKYETMVAGRRGAASATRVPSEIAARSALLEARQVIRRWRKDVKGEHLMTSELELTLELSRRACSIIKLVYGSKAGTTLVRGDDILWTCLRSGSFSRLVLRHLPLFQSILEQQKRKMLPFVTYYKTPRRMMMLEFVDALKRETETLKRNVQSLPVLSRTLEIADVSRQTIASLLKVIALMDGISAAADVRAAISLVASEAVHDIAVVQSSASGVSDALTQFWTQISVAAEAYTSEPNQDVRREPTLLTANAWSARRLDTRVVKDWMHDFNSPGSSIDELTNLLSPLTLSEDETAVFYCPMGSILTRMPSPSPFSVQSLSRRTVVFREMKRSIAWLDGHVSGIEDKDDAITVDSFGDETQVPMGPSRHPLTVQLNGKTVWVHLSEAPVDGDAPLAPAEQEGPETTPLETLQSWRTLQVDHAQLRKRMLASRRIGFDAERLLFGICLAKHIVGNARTSIVIRARTNEQVVAASIAVSMASDLYGLGMSAYLLQVKDEASARGVLATTLRRIDSAWEQGFRTCFLCELTVCM